MNQLRLLFWVVSICLHDQALSQTTLCAGNLRYGGFCLGLRETCPAGTFEYSPYSNYVGCSRVDQKCCANNPQGTVKNPNGIIATPLEKCGLGSMEPSSRILDGVITGPCDWPFVVSIRAKITNMGGLTYLETSHACQGVLVDPSWVLTNPACILSSAFSAEEAPRRILVVAGEYNVSGIDTDPVTGTQQEQVIRVKQVFVHPNYQFRTQEELFPFENTKEINSNAVALIKLMEPIVGRCSGIACLPSAAEAANNCAAYDECIITGWGFSSESYDTALKDELLLGRVRLTSGVACDFLTQRLNLTSSRPVGSICQNPRDRNTDSCLSDILPVQVLMTTPIFVEWPAETVTVFTTGWGQVKHFSTCNPENHNYVTHVTPGDEGGAVLCSNGYNWVIRGLLPFNLCINGRYNLYVTDVATYLPWIQSTMANAGAGSQTRPG